MGWNVLRNEVDPNDPQDGDYLLRCPCGSADSIIISNISVDVVRDGKVVSLHRGHRRACQRCPNVFSTGPDGVYAHHPMSLPVVGNPQRSELAPRPTTPNEIGEHPSRLEPLVPKARPVL